jgi:hypothetical protein
MGGMAILELFSIFLLSKQVSIGCFFSTHVPYSYYFPSRSHFKTQTSLILGTRTLRAFLVDA